ncbi:hypothetical protein T12_1665 [Trichinella patagoniensis]|uniref:Uncharacterized protein n=1 Tax=Trichinella patagoniensis TaxID=990121 RepID=A0A0V0Z4X8_9BILA|nr:hypothetical protein T12_1665 [Trichinella patagoniensis]
MSRHLISDAYEWINKIPSVPIYYLAKPQPRERAWQNQRGKKTLLSLTLRHERCSIGGRLSNCHRSRGGPVIANEIPLL